MKKRVLYIFFLATMGMGMYSFPSQDPPEPQDKSHSDGASGPCGQPDQGQGVPPPVGLCLPINDYLLPLLISGILLGVYKLKRAQNL